MFSPSFFFFSNRFEGYWWSPSSDKLLVVYNDESGLASYDIPHLGKSSPTSKETHSFPFTGGENPKVDLYIIEFDYEEINEESNENFNKYFKSNKKRTTYLDISSCLDSNFYNINYNKENNEEVEEKIENNSTKINSINQNFHRKYEYYLSSVEWKSSDGIFLHIQNRELTHYKFIYYDLILDQPFVVIQEFSNKYINKKNLTYFLPSNFSYKYLHHTTNNPDHLPEEDDEIIEDQQGIQEVGVDEHINESVDGDLDERIEKINDEIKVNEGDPEEECENGNKQEIGKEKKYENGFYFLWSSQYGDNINFKNLYSLNHATSSTSGAFSFSSVIDHGLPYDENGGYNQIYFFYYCLKNRKCYLIKKIGLSGVTSIDSYEPNSETIFYKINNNGIHLSLYTSLYSNEYIDQFNFNHFYEQNFIQDMNEENKKFNSISTFSFQYISNFDEILLKNEEDILKNIDKDINKTYILSNNYYYNNIKELIKQKKSFNNGSTNELVYNFSLNLFFHIKSSPLKPLQFLLYSISDLVENLLLNTNDNLFINKKINNINKNKNNKILQNLLVIKKKYNKQNFLYNNFFLLFYENNFYEKHNIKNINNNIDNNFFYYDYENYSDNNSDLEDFYSNSYSFSTQDNSETELSSGFDYTINSKSLSKKKNGLPIIYSTKIKKIIILNGVFNNHMAKDIINGLSLPKYFMIPSLDNRVRLNLLLYLPKEINIGTYLEQFLDEKKEKKINSSSLPTYSLVLYTYGGPTTSLINYDWPATCNLFHQYLITRKDSSPSSESAINNPDNNFYILSILDNRGSVDKGFYFESYVKDKLHHYEVIDQLSGIIFLLLKLKIIHPNSFLNSINNQNDLIKSLLNNYMYNPQVSDDNNDNQIDTLITALKRIKENNPNILAPLTSSSTSSKGSICVYGHSYGGSQALQLLFNCYPLISHCISISPVIDWLYYDTYYTGKIFFLFFLFFIFTSLFLIFPSL